MKLDRTSGVTQAGGSLERAWLRISLLLVGACVGIAVSWMLAAEDHEGFEALRARLGLPSTASLPTLQLDMKFKAFETLRSTRERWHQTGLRTAPLPLPAAAGIRVGEQEVDATVTLMPPAMARKPTPLGRLLLDLRANVSTLAGAGKDIRRVSTEDPGRRGLIQELVFYALLSEAGGIAPRFTGVQLYGNGERWGPCILVEQPSMEMVTASGRPMGALVGWDAPVLDGVDADSGQWLTSPVPAHWSTGTRVLAGTAAETHTAWGQTQLDRLRAGAIAVDQAVDVTATAQVLALLELTGTSSRVVGWDQFRWYVHPERLLLVPLVRLEPEPAAPEWLAALPAPTLLANPALRAALEKQLAEWQTRLQDSSTRDKVLARVRTAWPTVSEERLRDGWRQVEVRLARLAGAQKTVVDPVVLPAAFAPTPVHAGEAP